MTATKVSETRYKELGLTRIAENETLAWPVRWAVIGMEFIALFIFWMMLSGHYQIKYIVIGLCASMLVTYLTHDYLFARVRTSRKNGEDIGYIVRSSWRLISYLPWLIVAIFKANIQVAMILIKPQMPIDPGFLKISTGLRRKISKVTLANSITITPGTITVEQKPGTLILHALVRSFAGDIETALLQNKIADIFDDSRDIPPNGIWARNMEELEQ
jgi:multicomponent Na+:H+ antiporter subunit E